MAHITAIDLVRRGSPQPCVSTPFVPIKTYRRFSSRLPSGLTVWDDPEEILEDLYHYRPGGHHPTHIGDTLGKDGRYHVIHKLGWGGIANIWLCRDLECKTPKYVGLKVLCAAASSADECNELRVLKLREIGLDQEVGGKHICLPLDHFWIDGPNGSHLCFVYPVLGPRVAELCRPLQESQSLEKLLQEAALQAVSGLAALHNLGICHGDFTPGNVLFGISNLDGLPEDEVIEILGEPETGRVATDDGEGHSDPTVPQYLVFPVDFDEVDSSFITDEVHIIDLGESFEASDPPKSLGIPGPYRPPELCISNVVGVGTDLWALGCTLYAIRTSTHLFDAWGNEVDERIHRIVRMLGKLPEPLWSAWSGNKSLYRTAADFGGRPYDRREMRAKQMRDDKKRDYGRDCHCIQEELAETIFHVGTKRRWPANRDAVEDEIEVLADLLLKLLNFVPEDRLTAKAALDHPFFKMKM